MIKKITLLLLVASLAACASFGTKEVSWIPTGPTFKAKDPKTVEVYASREDIKRPFDNLGMARVHEVRRTRTDLKAALDKIVKIAAERGADGVLVQNYSDEELKVDTIMVVGYPFKYLDNLTEEDKAAVQEFLMFGVLDEYSYR
ncbi:hypothetical protein Dip510_002117 [Elusimicrobium posterum]|uniref:hypothetical protein n=1 Tax=Elusimicrobium posterum TaxID=3116653 RepID=UPI003C706A9E